MRYRWASRTDERIKVDLETKLRVHQRNKTQNVLGVQNFFEKTKYSFGFLPAVSWSLTFYIWRIYLSVDLPTFYFTIFIFHEIFKCVPFRLGPPQLHYTSSVSVSTALILLLMKAGLFSQNMPLVECAKQLINSIKNSIWMLPLTWMWWMDEMKFLFDVQTDIDSILSMCWYITKCIQACFF